MGARLCSSMAEGSRRAHVEAQKGRHVVGASRSLVSSGAQQKGRVAPRGKLLVVVRAHGGLYVYGPRLVETGKAGEQTGRDTNHHAAVGPGG